MENDFEEYVIKYLKKVKDPQAVKKIWRWLDRLQTEGHSKLMMTNDVKKIKTKKHDLYELRIKFGHILYRLFFIISTEKYIFIHAYDKRDGERTPQKEIDICLSKIR